MNAEIAPTAADDKTHPRERTPFRFTLRGMMALFVGVAAGTAEAQLEHPHWGDAILVGLSAWAVFGLAHQLADLRRASPNWKLLTTDERWGARFAVGWRVAVIVLLLANYAVRTLLAGKLIALPEESQAFFFFEPEAALRRALLCLLLMFALWSAPRLRSPARRRSIVWQGLQGIAVASGAALCLLLWWQLSLIHFLVQVACVGVEAYQPSRFAIPNFNIAVLYPAFVRQSLMAVILAGASLALIGILAENWRHSRRRWILLSCLGAALATSSWHTAWLMLVGVRRVSPWMAEAFEIDPVYRWFTAGLVVTVAAAAISMRQACRSAGGDRGPLLAWRGDASRYYHEWRSWSTGCMLAAAAGIAQESIRLARWTSGTETLEAILEHPMVAMYAAVCLLGLRATHSGTAVEGPELTAMSLPGFCVFFLANLLAFGCAIPAIAAFSSSLWLTRWYELGSSP